MLKRNCPVCNSNNSQIIMKFTPELLVEVNPTYNLEVVNKAFQGKENLVNYSECKNCGMIFCETVWDDSTLRMIYDDAIDHKISKEKTLGIKKRISLTRMWLNILRLLQLSGEKKLQNLKVIDFGCGWGDFVDVVTGFGVEVIGYDGDSKKTELPIQRGHKIVKNIEELKSFAPVDVFVMISVLEHLQDVDFFMNLVKDILKKDGIFLLIVTDYRKRFIKKNSNLLNKNLPALTKNLNPIEHVNIYSYKSIMQTLKKFNFEFISTGNTLYLTDNLLTRNNSKIIKFFNKVEKISSEIITGSEIGIVVYSKNKK